MYQKLLFFSPRNPRFNGALNVMYSYTGPREGEPWMDRALWGCSKCGDGAGGYANGVGGRFRVL